MGLFNSLVASYKVLKYLFFKICYGFLWLPTSDFLHGVSATRRRLASNDCTLTETVEIFSIIDKFPLQRMLADPKEYILRHESFDRPAYLLKPNIYMAFIQSDMVYFVESDSSDNPYDTKRFPFFFLSHKEIARKVLTIHINQFIKLGELIGGPKCDLTWMFHTGRCGSTALVQALNSVDGVTAISESQHLTLYLAENCVASRLSIKDFISTKKFEDLNIACNNFLFKDFGIGEKVCLKTALMGQYEVMLPLVEKRYPHHKVISVHRDGQGSANSLNKSLPPLSTKIFAYLYWFSEKTGFLRSFLNKVRFIFSSGMIYVEKELLSEETDLYLLGYLMWISNMAHFRRHADQLSNLMTVCHSDFLDDRRRVVTQVFEYMGIGVEHIDKAMEALQGDSQAGTPLARDALLGKDWVRDEIVVSVCEQLLSKYDLPPFDSKFRYKQSSEVELIT